MNERRGYLLIALAASFWATSGTIVKLLYSYHFDSFTLAFLRSFFAFVIAVIVALVVRPAALRVPLRQLLFFAIFAFVGISLFTALYYLAFSVTTVATAVVLLYTAPIFVVVLARALYGERFTASKTVALVLAIAGCALVAGLYRPGHLLVNAAGILFGLGAGFTYALYSVYGKKMAADYNPLTIAVYIMGFGALFLFPVRPSSLIALAGSPPEAWLLVLVLALLPALIPYMLYPAGLRFIEVGRASLIATVEPVVAMLLAFVVLGEGMEPLQILGAALVISAALVAQTASRARG